MTDKEFIALAQLLVMSVTRVAERVKATEQRIDTDGLNINVEPAPVTVEAAQVSVDVPETDFSAVVEAINGLTADNVASQMQTVSQAITALAEKEGLDLGPLVEAQSSVGESIGTASERIAESHDRLIDAQAETNSALVRLADDLAKSQGAVQMQFTSVLERIEAMQKDMAGQAGHIDMLHQAITAPKKLTFGADGKPDGVVTELRQ